MPLFAILKALISSLVVLATQLPEN